MKKLTRIAIVLLILTLAVSMVGCQNNTTKTGNKKPVIKIAYLPITHALPLFVEAELQKENPNYEIELVKYGSWAELTDALNTGRVDGASVLIELAIKAKEQEIGVTAVALGHKDGNVIVVGNDINSAQDLKGKTFAIPHRQSSHNILYNQMLEKAGINVGEINVVELSPSEMPSALASGQIAGYCVAEPFGAKSVALQTGKVLYESNELWNDSICCSLVLTNDFIQKNNDTAKEFVKNYQEAGTYIGTNPTESNAIAKKYLSVDDKVLELSMKWISYDDLAITKEAYESLTQYMVKYGISSNPPAYKDFVNNFLEN